MEWQAPAALFLGLTLPAILALYFLKRRRPRRRVPSILLWQPALRQDEASVPWQRLRLRLILLLQLLVAAFLTLAAARPLWVGAAGAGVHRIVLLDGSGSMRAATAPGGPDRYEVALRRVRELARDMAPGDRMSVIYMGTRPQALVTAAARPGQVEAALARAPHAGYGPAAVQAALDLAAALTGREGAAEWVLVSDGALDLPPGAALPRPGVAFRHLAVAEGEPDPAGNVAVTALATREAGPAVAVQVGVANLGAQEAAGTLVLEGDGRPVASKAWRLGPGQATHFTWERVPPAAVFTARLEGIPPGQNALTYDDAAWAVTGQGGRIRALLVSPGSRFLEQALAAHGAVDAFRVAPEDYGGVSGTTFDLTIFDRWLPPAWPPGAALVVGPPAGSSLVPVSGEFRPEGVSPRPDHPVLAHVDWGSVHVARAAALAAGAAAGGTAWQPVVDSRGGPLVAVQETGTSRRAILTFRLSDSDIGLRPAFPVLMANLIDWLVPRPVAFAGALRPGQVLPLPPLPLAEAVWAVAPGGARTALAPPWPPGALEPDRPGLWYLAVQRDSAAGGGERLFPLAVNGYDPQESRITGRPVTLSGPGGAAPAAAAARWPLWPGLTLAALAVSLAEWWVDGRGR